MPIRAFEHAWNSRWWFAVGSGSDRCLVQHCRNGNRANLAFWEGKTFRGYSWRGQKVFASMRDGSSELRTAKGGRQQSVHACGVGAKDSLCR